MTNLTYVCCRWTGYYQWERDIELYHDLLSVPSKGVPVAPLIAARADHWLGGEMFGNIMQMFREVNTCSESEQIFSAAS